MKKLILCGLLTAGLISGCASDREVEFVAPLTEIQPSLPITKIWQTSAGGNGTDGQFLRQNPALSHGRIYSANYNGVVSAVDAAHGRRIWQTSVRETITSGVGAGNGVVVVGTSCGNVYALTEDCGAVKWKMPTSSEILATPVVAGNKVLVKTESGDLTAFDITTGQRAWNYHHNPPELTLRGASSPVVVGNTVIAGLSDGQLVSLNLQNGRTHWIQQVAVPHGASIIERLVDIDASPVVRDGVIYVVTYQGKLAAVDLSSGHVRWSQDVSSFAGLAVDQRKVYVTDVNSHIWAYDRNTGRVVWHQDQLEGRGATKPALHSCAVAVGDSCGFVHWLSTNDGHFVARQNVDSSRLLAEPLTYSNELIVLSSKGNLAAFATN